MRKGFGYLRVSGPTQAKDSRDGFPRQKQAVLEWAKANDVRIVHECRQQDGTADRVTEYYVGTKGMMEPSAGPIKTGKKVKPEPLGAAYVREHKDLIESINAGKPLNEGRQVAESTLTAIMGREAAYTGQEVAWDELLNCQQDLVPTDVQFGPMPVPPVAMPGQTILARSWRSA